jgi:(p)ppGpp synthase/HD superfamily hydrolase
MRHVPAAPATQTGRAAAMAERLATTARQAGIDEAGTTRILDAYHAAMRPRQELLADDHHPDYLHPGRTALILMDDLGVRDPRLIAAGTLLESHRPELAAPAINDDEVQALIAEVPTPARDGELLLELLLAADHPIRLIALAERLDQVRRLHLREPREWSALHQETNEIYLPIASRTDPTLARRYRWWCRIFQQRFLDSAATPLATGWP